MNPELAFQVLCGCVIVAIWCAIVVKFRRRGWPYRRILFVVVTCIAVGSLLIGPCLYAYWRALTRAGEEFTGDRYFGAAGLWMMLSLVLAIGLVESDGRSGVLGRLVARMRRWD